MKTAKEIYNTDVRLLPQSAKLELAIMILENMAKDSSIEQLGFDFRVSEGHAKPEPAYAHAEDLG